MTLGDVVQAAEAVFGKWPHQLETVDRFDSVCKVGDVIYRTRRASTSRGYEIYKNGESIGHARSIEGATIAINADAGEPMAQLTFKSKPETPPDPPLEVSPAAQ
jgi:hypothetical protein